MKISIICASLPPKLDGIGDYTSQIAELLAVKNEVTILTSEEKPDPIPGVNIEKRFDKNSPKSYWGILEHVKTSQPDWLVLQYNPFSYGKWGKNLILPKVMDAVKAVSGETKIALMVHEPFVPLTGFRFAVMTTWQRWQLWSLGRSSDLLFFSIDPWAKRFGHWFPNKPAVHLSVGSNIPRVSIAKDTARAKYGITSDQLVLGVFGQAHIARLSDYIRDSAAKLSQAGRQVVLLYIGPIGAMAGSNSDAVKVVTTGRLDSGDVSIALSCVDIFLAAFADGISTRRSSLMAGLKHGLPTVGTTGSHTDEILTNMHESSLLLSDWKDKSAFIDNVITMSSNPELRDKMGQAAREIYESQFDWPVVVEKMGTALEKYK